MGEARRRIQNGLPPRTPRTNTNNQNDDSPRIVDWLPITDKQRNQFIDMTIKGGWLGIGALVFIWVLVRIIGPAAGWWVPADLR